MERPGRPSRHKSNPISKFPVRPNFSSDSESELNDTDLPIQITYYQHPPESGTVPGAPSTSSGQQGNQGSTEAPNNTMRVSPMPLRVTLSPVPIPPRDDEPRTEQQPQETARRKRTASTLTTSSLGNSAASVIFDSVDSLIGSNTTNRANNSPDRPLERFQHSDYVIRPRSFCSIEYSNAIRPQFYKIKRPLGPIDLTPSGSTSRDSSSQAPVVTASFSLHDSATQPNASSQAPVVTSSFSLRDSSLPTTSSDPSPSNYYRLGGPSVSYGMSQRTDPQPPSDSTILRQFDDMCSTSPVVRRRPRYSVRFLNEGRCSDNPTEMMNVNPLGNNTNRNTTLDDYCDLVGNFLFNYPPPLNNTEHQRISSPPPPERNEAPVQQTSRTSLDIIDRHLNISPDIINNERSIINSMSPYPDDHPVIDGGEVMEQSNDDIIMVETPERPPLPSSPDSYMVPSSRSPTPPPTTPSASAQNKRDKAQKRRCGDVPMTLQDLNQTLISLLECPVCLDHATPPIYQCSKGHILCQSCHPRLTTCPICRSRLPGDRNSAMEKVAEKLMYPCKNTVTGCSLMLKLDDKQEHEDGCGFRHYICIITACHWKGYKPELVVHMQSTHPDKLITGNTKEVHVPLAVQVGGSMFFAHHWIQSAHNEVFNVVFHVDLYKRIMKGCVQYIGSPDKADKFTYLFELKQRVPPFRKLSYSRATHADTLKPGQPLCLSNDFSINIDMARLYRSEDCTTHTIPVFVSIFQVE